MTKKLSLVVGCLWLCWPLCLAAQQPPQTTVLRTTFVGAESENYLRYLQTLGLTSGEPWSVRSFTPPQQRALQPKGSGHPWAGSELLERPAASGRWGIELVSPTAQLWYNSAFPFGTNDGAVWVGRGLTTAVSGGVAIRAGVATLIIAPTAFYAANAPFALMPNGLSGPRGFGNAEYPDYIDWPQRFGDAPYSRLDPGQSVLRVDWLGVGAGFSTANEWWGPMSEFPHLLGNNAAGFPHAFLGTSRPVATPLGRFHWRVLYGQLGQTRYGPAVGGDGRRFASGLVGVYQPPALTGLELGASRFFHAPWPGDSLSSDYFTHILETFIKQKIGKVFAPLDGDPNQSADNQLASLFARWRTADAGFEVYAEYGREDHNWDARDYMVELDHGSTIGIGARKAWFGRDGRLSAIRFENIGAQRSPLGRHRAEAGNYIHSWAVQGHTQYGQLLGAGFAVGSFAGTALTWEQYDDRGWSVVSAHRYLVGDSARADVQYALRLAQTRALRRAPGTTLTAGVTLVRELNRHNDNGDATNARLELSISHVPRSERPSARVSASRPR